MERGPIILRGHLATGFFFQFLVSALLICSGANQAFAELRGHGGPVRALAISSDGSTAISGSFDQSAILWNLRDATAISVLRFHSGAVNAAAALPDGRFLTGGEDGRIGIWRVGESNPVATFQDHSGPIVGLAVSPDGQYVASASWDAMVRVRQLQGGIARVLEGHQGNVNAVAFLPDGRIVSAGYDATLRIWPKEGGGTPLVVKLPTPLNAVMATKDGEIATAGADGVVYLLSADGVIRASVEARPSPVIALALSPDETRIAAATMAGAAVVIERSQAKALFELVGAGLPIWSLAFRPGSRELLTGGADRAIRQWDAITGEAIRSGIMTPPENELAKFKGDRGAELFQACAACHTLTADGGNRAGPSLNGLFGRRIASAPGYNFSRALKDLDIVWNAETVGKLFEIGPARYTPGTKMPEQIIGNAHDREALVHFLEKATKAP